MEHFWINAAGLPAEITAQHPLTRRLCQDYEISPPQSPAVLTACAEPETAMRLADGAASPAYLEFLCIHDSLAAQLPAHHRFLMHGAAVAFDGAAYLFTAPSGTGKTTHVRLWRQYLGSRVTVVNGDKPFLSLEPDGTSASGAPPGPAKSGGRVPSVSHSAVSACWSAARTASAACRRSRRWRPCSARRTIGTIPPWSTSPWAFWTHCCAVSPCTG